MKSLRAFEEIASHASEDMFRHNRDELDAAVSAVSAVMRARRNGGQ